MTDCETSSNRKAADIDRERAAEAERERLERAQRAVNALLDKKAQGVSALDVRALFPFADTFVFATGSSDRHVRALADSLMQTFAQLGEKPLGEEGYAEGRWVLVDLNDIVVHIFVPEAREYYDLDRLWSDAPRIELEATSQRRSAP